MSKRIVVGLDGSRYSACALDLAIRRAKAFDSVIIGVAVIDSPAIERIALGAQPGVVHLAEGAVSRTFRDAKHHAESLIARFRDACDAADIPHEDVIHAGQPYEMLIEESKTADLVVMGLRTFYHFPTHEGPGDTLRQLLKHPVAPVLAVPDAAELPGAVIFAYDGTPGAARALQAYVHITPFLPASFPVSLLCVAREYDRHKYDLEKAAVYLRAHGYEPRLLVRTGTPAEAILKVAEEQHPALVILGSPPYRGISERLFGSVASTIIEKGTVAVFVFH